MKKITALLPALCMTLALFAGCGQQSNTPTATAAPTVSAAPAQTEAPAATPEPTEEPEPLAADKGPMPHDEFDRAVWYGFLPEDMADMHRDAQVTWKQYCEMIGNMLTLQDPALGDEWQEIAALALTSDERMQHDQGRFALYRAMELMGLESLDLDYLASIPNLHWIENFTRWEDWSFEYRPFTGDGEQGMWAFQDVETRDFGTQQYDQIAVMECCHRLSLVSFELLYDPDVRLNVPLTVHDALCSVIRLYESQPEVATPIWTAWQEALSEEAASRPEPEEITARRDAILNSPTTIVKADTYIPGETYSGTAYYVSNSGNDDNDGRSPETAWATLERVNRQPMQYGDAVFLERGGIYRGFLTLWTPGVTLSAYGEGAKPVVTSSEENAADAEKWELYSENNGAKIWKYYKDVTDCGGIFFEDRIVGAKVLAVWSGTEWVNGDGTPFDVTAALTEDLDFFNDDGGKFHGATEIMDISFGTPSDVQYGPLYLRCDAGNPGELFDDIELGTNPVKEDHGYLGFVIGAVDEVTIDNISIKYYPMGGIGYGTNGCVVQNCEFSWGGGNVQIMRDGVAIGMTGDALCGSGAVDLTVRDNYFHDLYSQGLIFEGSSDIKNVTVSGNLMERTAGINIMQQNGDIDGLVISGNIFAQSGLSWGDWHDLNYSGLWKNGDWMKDIRIRLWNTHIANSRISDNAFYDSLQVSLYYSSDFYGERPACGGNRYYFSESSHAFAWWNTSETPQLYHTVMPGEAEDFLRNYLHDDTSQIIYR